MGSTRFVCKSEWDMMIFFRFGDLDSLKAFLGSDTKTSASLCGGSPPKNTTDPRFVLRYAEKLDPLVKELEGLSKVPVHSQNFVADDV